ncbi:hypothetical protein AAFF_G00375120 [Aldrovandia affinis]|uniref:DNA repair protein XRCC4 n=1 Tax=Aldrovandia affinis TaxID=143900 RepID=A0AAD7SI85_9TELE|nr:hypothetical protein AAFF_G00375120 [Aldrovandia affinis]
MKRALSRNKTGTTCILRLWICASRMNVSVRKISVSSELGRTFFLKVDWAEDLGRGFAVVLCDGVSAWDGNVSEGDVTRRGYAFHLSPDSACSGVLRLSYEKVQKDISFSLGSMELRTVLEPSEVIKELIGHGLERSTKLQASNRHLQEENQRLRQDQEHMTAEMERYAHGKEALEKELYTRFVQVLNEKKAKIRGLLEKIRQLQEDLEEKEQREQGAAPTGPGSVGKRRAQRAPVRELPAHSSIEDSLTDIIDVAPCRKRRQRHLQGPESQEVQKKESKEPTRSKEETKRKAVRRSAAIAAIATASTEADDLFDDF